MNALARFALGLGLLLGAAPAALAMTIQPVTSPGGITAWLVEDHTQHVISLEFGIKGGASGDPTDRPGLSTLVASTLDEGAGSLDSGAFQGRLAELSASISFKADKDKIGGSLQTLAPTRDEVFELLRLALTEPRFDAPAVDRVRAEIDQLLDSQDEDPASVAHLAWYRTQFPNHPYGVPALGTKAGIAAITLDELKAYPKTRMGRDRLMVAVVGDITPDDLKPLLDKTFGGLPATSHDPVTPGATAPLGGGKVVLLKKPVPQSVMFFGEVGISVHDKDFFAALVVNKVLGTGFGSRLMDEVREKRGLAYGIGTNLPHLDHVDLILGQVGTQNARAAETLAIIRAEWAKLAASGPGGSELADAKTYLNGAYPLGLDSTSAIAVRLLGLQESDLGIDYFERRPRSINAVTLEDAKRVAKRLLDTANLSFVVVGDPAGITPDQVITAP